MALENSKLNFVNFVVPKFLFEKHIDGGNKSFFDIKPRAIISRKNNQFHINIEVEMNDVENDFLLKMLSVGIFEYETEDEDMLLNFMSVNGPAIIFPYIRGFISNLTALSGFDTITLPTLNLSGFKEDLIKSLVEIDNE